VTVIASEAWRSSRSVMATFQMDTNREASTGDPISDLRSGETAGSPSLGKRKRFPGLAMTGSGRAYLSAYAHSRE
jgi:hypothetical protein